MKNHYDLLGVPHDAPSDAIKRAFRREIARYHPDKVQHLGQEFQDMAVARAAELTEAYRVLSDIAARAAYDDRLAKGEEPAAPRPAARPSPEPARSPAAPHETAAPSAGSEPPAAEPQGEDRTFLRERQSSDHFVRRESLRRVRDVIAAAFDGVESIGAKGFELSCECLLRRTLFKKADPDLRVLVRYVPEVNAEIIHETWPLAVRAAAGFPQPVCVFLIGPSLGPRADLASAIATERRRTKSAHIVVVPVDVHDWEPIMPTNAPAAVRTIVERLKRQS